MSLFTIYNPRTKRQEKITVRTLINKTRRSAEWFKKSIVGAFKKKPIPNPNDSRTDNATRVATTGQLLPPSAALAGNSTLTDPAFKMGTRTVKRVEVGRLYFFLYDPKHKKTLPYYDTFPLVLVLGKFSDGYLALNFHYLRYLERGMLMEALDFAKRNVSRRGKQEEIYKVSYDILKSSRANRFIAPTIKRYLYAHVRSPFVEAFTETSREMAVFMPNERFKKASKSQVWRDTRA